MRVREKWVFVSIPPVFRPDDWYGGGGNVWWVAFVGRVRKTFGIVITCAWV